MSIFYQQYILAMIFTLAGFNSALHSFYKSGTICSLFKNLELLK